MGNPYPADIIDANSVARLGVEIDFTDAANQPGGAVGFATVPISSAQILALRASPVEIVPAPGVGSYVNVLLASFAFAPGATPYTPVAGSFLVVTPTPAAAFGGGYAWEAPAAGLIDSATAQVDVVPAFVSGAYATTTLRVATADVENLAWVLTNDRAGEHTLGDGTMTVTAVYTICALP